MARSLSTMRRAELERIAGAAGLRDPQLYNVPELREALGGRVRSIRENLTAAQLTDLLTIRRAALPPTFSGTQLQVAQRLEERGLVKCCAKLSMFKGEAWADRSFVVTQLGELVADA